MMIEKLRMPDGYMMIANNVALMLVRTDEYVENQNCGVHAACHIEDGEQELFRRFYSYQKAD